MLKDNNQLDWSTSEEGQLAVDVIEDQNSIIIKTAIAGVEPDDIEVNVAADLVTIRGEREGGYTKTDSTYHFQECFWGAFSRSIVLPCHINPDEAEATFKNGVLTLTLPKSRGEMRVPIKKEV